ncbi:MAG: alanyl-tRNA editing protein [Rhodocyclaceae bacterium]|nr:alanyl-tRNA editing protein [Rhodocyclaceae bacterium]
MTTIALFHDDAYAERCDAKVVRSADGQVVLDRTVFYPTGGGQPGDRGELCCADGSRVVVVDTVKGGAGEILHRVDSASPMPAAGSRVEARIDWPRRHRLMRYHTALHLLCAVVPAAVSGGRISDDKAHLDFDIDMSRLDRATIERRLADLVAADLLVEAGSIAEGELEARPDLVRTMSVQPPRGHGAVRTIRIEGVDYQPCGGTHVRRTGEIGGLRVSRIRSEGRRNKRVTIVLDDMSS